LWGGLWAAIGCVCLWMLGSWALETRHTFFSPVLPTLSATTSLAILTIANVVLTPDEYSRMRTHPHLGYNAIVDAFVVVERDIQPLPQRLNRAA
jgi:hypothetical protein